MDFIFSRLDISQFGDRFKMYGAIWSLLLKILFKFSLKIQDGEELPCHTVSNVIDLFP